jgi:preprotein translocase subunit SecF
MTVYKFRAIWYTLSGTLVLGSMIAFAVFGLKVGIDFTGGSMMAVRFGGDRPSAIEIERSLDGLDLGPVIVQPVGDHDANIRMKTLTEAEHTDVLKRLTDTFKDTSELQFNAIGPAIGAELRTKAIEALIVALLAILIYIAFSFRKVSVPVQNWKYGVITVLTAFHDTIVPVGVFVLLGKVGGWEVDTTFVVALLTILGYSINDTIVVLDRVRENLHRMSGSFEDIVDVSLRQTYVRSLNTTFATLCGIVAVYFFGGASLKPFALALGIGISVGAYSSIFIGPPLLITWEKFSRKRRKQ